CHALVPPQACRHGHGPTHLPLHRRVSRRPAVGEGRDGRRQRVPFHAPGHPAVTSGSAQPLVYVVDDDQEFRDSAKWLLEAAGFRVSMYATAEHFLATWDPASAACV